MTIGSIGSEVLEYKEVKRSGCLYMVANPNPDATLVPIRKAGMKGCLINNIYYI